jgi:hypothetical protein
MEKKYDKLIFDFRFEIQEVFQNPNPKIKNYKQRHRFKILNRRFYEK